MVGGNLHVAMYRAFATSINIGGSNEAADWLHLIIDRQQTYKPVFQSFNLRRIGRPCIAIILAASDQPAVIAIQDLRLIQFGKADLLR